MLNRRLLKAISHSLAGLLTLAALSCQESATHESHTHTPTDDNLPLFEKSFRDYSALMQHVILNVPGHFRGTSLGMTKEQVRGIEPAKFEELAIDTMDNESLRFSSEFNLHSNADFEYHFGEYNSLQQIVCSIYFNSPQARDSLFQELVAFNSSEKGKTIAQVPNEQYTWKISDSISYRLQSEGANLQPTITITVFQP